MALLDFSPDGSTMSGIDHTPTLGSPSQTCSKITAGDAVNGSEPTPSAAVFLYAIPDSDLTCGFIAIKFSPAPTRIARILWWVKGYHERLLRGTLSKVGSSVRRKERERVWVKACRAPTGNPFVVHRTSGEPASWLEELGVALRFAGKDRAVRRRLRDRLVSVNHALIPQSSLHNRTFSSTSPHGGRRRDSHRDLSSDNLRPC